VEKEKDEPRGIGWVGGYFFKRFQETGEGGREGEKVPKLR